VNAELKPLGMIGPGSAPAPVRILLNDFSPVGVGVFSKIPLSVGQEIAVTFQEPRRFYVKGRILWCKEYHHGSPVMSDNNFSYRVGVEFVFESEEESQQVVKFYEELCAILYGGASQPLKKAG